MRSPMQGQPSSLPEERSDLNAIDHNNNQNNAAAVASTSSGAQPRSATAAMQHTLATPPRPNPKPGAVATPRRVGKGGVPFLPPYSPADLFCAFCGGDRTHNRHRRTEDMVSCYECGSSGHPTCLEWDDWALVKRVKSYAWLCQECKRCEVCDEKGDDDPEAEPEEEDPQRTPPPRADDLLFCDACDRGWHRLCLDPPLAAVPRGKWTCPTCVRQSEFSAEAILPPDKRKRERRQAKPLGLVATPSGAMAAPTTVDGSEGTRKSTRERRSATQRVSSYALEHRSDTSPGSSSPPVLRRHSPLYPDAAGSSTAAHSAALNGGVGPSPRITFKVNSASGPGSSARPSVPAKKPRIASPAVGAGGASTPLYQPWLEPRFPSPPPARNGSGDALESAVEATEAEADVEGEGDIEGDAAASDPYGGLLSPAEADGAGRAPSDRDRERWRRARAEWERREWVMAKRVEQREKAGPAAGASGADGGAPPAAQGTSPAAASAATGGEAQSTPGPNGGGRETRHARAAVPTDMHHLDPAAGRADSAARAGVSADPFAFAAATPLALDGADSAPGPYSSSSSASAARDGAALTASSLVPGYSLPIRPITHLRIGEFDLETWYQAPFPEEYTRVPEGVLWVCEWCLKYVKSAFESERHKVSQAGADEGQGCFVTRGEGADLR